MALFCLLARLRLCARLGLFTRAFGVPDQPVQRIPGFLYPVPALLPYLARAIRDLCNFLL